MSEERKQYEFSGVIYLRDDEIEDFEDALENAICPDESENHDCRLGTFGIRFLPDE